MEPRPVPKLNTETGELAATPNDATDAWVRYHCKVHWGRAAAVDDLVHEAACAADSLADVAREIRNVPAHCEIRGVFGRVQAARAPEEDCITPKVHRLCGTQLADIFHPVCVKAALLLCEPLQWRGGLATHFPKPGGKPPTCDGHRYIFLGDVTGKSYHKLPCLLMKRALDSGPTWCGPAWKGGSAG